MSLIHMEGINKSFYMGTELFQALKNINLTINQNEYAAIIGRSGSGKSTLMNILGCLDTADSGSYKIDGRPANQLSEAELSDLRNRSIGFIFQSFNLFPRANVLANVMQPLVYRIMSNKERKQRALDALSRVGLSKKIDHLPSQLSGGQRQRVAIARALVTNPSIVLGDEPTGNLDSKTARDIMSLFDELHQEGQTIILVTHEQEIADHCSRVIQLADGVISNDSSQSKARMYV